MTNQLDLLQDHLDRRRSDTPQIKDLIDVSQILSDAKSYNGCRLNLIMNITNKSKGKPSRVPVNGCCRISFISNGEMTVFRLSFGSMACQARARAPLCKLLKDHRSGIRHSFGSLDQPFQYPASSGCTLSRRERDKTFRCGSIHSPMSLNAFHPHGRDIMNCLPLLRCLVFG